MGANSNIQWTDHTFNPWWGCEKVSPGCKNCYAEAHAVTRLKLPVWGAGSERKMFKDAHWREPLKWQADAEKAGVRARVFCASMADVFEDYRGPNAKEVVTARTRLLRLINATPNLDWLLLTKRPENVAKLWPVYSPGIQFYSNIWIGCTIEDQEQAERRIEALLSIPARIHFVSYEPALERIDLTRIKLKGEPGSHLNALTGAITLPGGDRPVVYLPNRVTWVIVGGESGSKARECNPSWLLQVVEACQEHKVPVFVKQLGANPEPRSGSGWGPVRATKGDNQDEWPRCLVVREHPNTTTDPA